MVSTVQELQDIGLSFSPVRFLGGSLSKQDYEVRRDKATKQQLNALLASQEYRQWMQKSLRGPCGSWKIEAGLILLGLLVVATIFSQAMWTRSPGVAQKHSAEELELLFSVQHSSIQEAPQALSAQIRDAEEELTKQLDRKAELELSLWSTEHHQTSPWTEKPSLLDSLLPWDNSSAASGLSGASVPQASASPNWLLIPGLAGAFLALVAALAQQLRYRRRALAAQAEARQLQQKIESALKAQNSAEQEVANIRASMAGKAGELKAATTAKHIAEAQVEDLQRRVLDLQRLRSAAVKLASHSSGSDPASPQSDGGSDKEREEMAEQLEALQQTIAERDSELLALNQELSDLADRLPREVQKSEESVVQVRQWLDQAQGQLQNTQTALTVKEQECRELQDQLQAQLTNSAVLQEALEAAKAREAELEQEHRAMAGEMQARVGSVMDLMKTTRLSLSQKLMQSQSTCEALAQELAARDQAARDCPVTPRLDVLKDSNKKATPSPKSSAGKSQGTPRMENGSPSIFKQAAAEPGKEDGLAQLLGQSRSPYWFAKSS